MSRKVHVGKRRSETRVAVVVERDRAYGRELCCGIADAALREDGWALEFVDADSLERPKALCGFDGVIARVVDDAMAIRLTATKLPVVDVLCNKRYPNFGSVDGDQVAIGRKAVGRTVQQELIASRLLVAKRLLANTTLPVAEVVARSGFASAQYFCPCPPAETAEICTLDTECLNVR